MALTGKTQFKVDGGGWQRLSLGVLSFGSDVSPVRLWNTAALPPLYNATVALIPDGTLSRALSADAFHV